MKIKTIALLTLLIIVISPLANASFSTRSASAERIAELKEVQAEAIKDGESMRQYQEIIGEYAMQTSTYENRLPIELSKMESIIGQHEIFIDKTLPDVMDKIEDMQEKYGVDDPKQLEKVLRQKINPKEWTGRQISVGFSGYQIGNNIKQINKLESILEQGLERAKQSAADTAKRNQKKVSSFPQHNYQGGDLGDIVSQSIAALISPKVAASDILNVAVISDWKSGQFPITQKPFRTIKASVLFADNDDDGLCRFNHYTFISIEGRPLEYKSIGAGGSYEGWAKCEEGVNANGGLASESGGGFISNLLWLLLVIANLFGGALLLKDKIKSIAQFRPVLAKALPHTKLIGFALFAIGVGSFALEVLSLSIFHNILPQISAVLLGAMLNGKLFQDVSEQGEVLVQKVAPHINLIGLSAIIVGVMHLILSGGLYLI